MLFDYMFDVVLQDQLLAEMEETSSEEEAYEQVFGKEHPGHVRGMGFGVVPSQMRKRYSC